MAVVGTIGSGKSSLLSALLGDMVRLEGEANVQGKVAYVPQQAWIRNATLRNNIIFGKKFKQEVYDRVRKSLNKQLNKNRDYHTSRMKASNLGLCFH